MSETVTARFRVEEILPTELILKHIEKGYIVFVQREQYRYDSSLWDSILQLEENTVKKITLESQNQMNTIWEITHIQSP